MNNKNTQCALAAVVLPIVLLLAGCNSENAFSDGSYQPTNPEVAPSVPDVGPSVPEPEPEPGPAIIEINVSVTTGVSSADLKTTGEVLPEEPESVTAFWRVPMQFKAVARYDDDTEADITASAEWEVTTDTTLGEFLEPGLFTTGSNPLPAGAVFTEIRASKDGIFSAETRINSVDLSDAYIDTFDIGDGTLFTNSPSQAYMNSIGSTSSTGQEIEDGSEGPAGTFFRYNNALAKTLCGFYSSIDSPVGGRTNWRLPTQAELEKLYDSQKSKPNLFVARGWAIGQNYWSSTSMGPSQSMGVDLRDGDSLPAPTGTSYYVSCVSTPTL